MNLNIYQKLLVCSIFTALSLNSPAFALETEQLSSNSKLSSPEIAKRLNHILEDVFQNEFSPGMSVAVIADGEIIFSKGYGYADLSSKRLVTENTPFYIASSTKSLIAQIAILLSERGAIDLNTPVKQLMPQLNFHPDINEQLVTLKTLLNHTHGIDGSGPITIRTAYTGEFSTSEELLQLLPYHAPNKNGNAFTYSNMGPVSGVIHHRTRYWKKLESLGSK